MEKSKILHELSDSMKADVDKLVAIEDSAGVNALLIVQASLKGSGYIAELLEELIELLHD